MALPPPRPTNYVDTQRYFDRREKSLDRWLSVLAIAMMTASVFLTLLAVVAAFLSYVGFRELQSLEMEAQQHVEEAKLLVEEIRDIHGEAAERLAVLRDAQTAAENPKEAARTVANVQQDPEASVIDQARADAILLQQQGKNEAAIEKWRAIANIVGEEDRQLQARAWFSIGYLLNDEELEAKIDAYTKAIELNPAYAVAYNNRGNTKNELGRYEAAIVDTDRAIELNPDHAAAYSNRGNAKHGLGHYEAAIADYDRAIELNPDYAVAYRNRGIANSELGRYEAAVADHDRAIELNPDYAVAYNDRGIANRRLGRITEARADYQKAIDLAQKAGDEDLAAMAQHNLRLLDN